MKSLPVILYANIYRRNEYVYLIFAKFKSVDSIRKILLNGIENQLFRD